MIRTALIAPVALVAALLAQPAFADSFGFDLPNLTYPTDGVTVSTAGCDAADPAVCGPVVAD